MNILVTGADGQLGSEIKSVSDKNINQKYFYTDIKSLNICNKTETEYFINKNNIEIIINCAAYTNVDKAESETEKAYDVNAYAPLILSEISIKKDIPVIHISTDYVYDSSTKNTPFDETDALNPVSVYAKSKLEGENNTIKNPKHIIIRTSWLYSKFGNNFVKTVQRISSEKQTAQIVFDQTGTPTSAADLAKVIIEIINRISTDKNFNLWGIYNYSNEGVCSWYDFAIEITKYQNNDFKIYPVKTCQYPTPAQRPAYSVMNKNKIKTNFNIEIPHWTISLKKYFE